MCLFIWMELMFICMYTLCRTTMLHFHSHFSRIYGSLNCKFKIRKSQVTNGKMEIWKFPKWQHFVSKMDSFFFLSSVHLTQFNSIRKKNTHTEIATLTHKFSSVTLYKNKTVRYAARMHAIIACQMEFQLYPMDIQICPIYIESCE